MQSIILRDLKKKTANRECSNTQHTHHSCYVYRTVFGLFICSRGNMENSSPLALPNLVIVWPIWYSAGPGPIFFTEGRAGLRPKEYCGPRGIRVSHFSKPNVLGNVYAAGPGPANFNNISYNKYIIFLFFFFCPPECLDIFSFPKFWVRQQIELIYIYTNFELWE